MIDTVFVVAVTHYDKHGEPKLPDQLIAGGVNFGLACQIGLVPLNYHEQMVVSLYRLFLPVLKVIMNMEGRVNHNTNNKVKCNAILFSHDAAEVLARTLQPDADLLTKDNMYQDFAIQFLDDKGRFDFMMKHIENMSTVFVSW